jgi:hypothetical protein
MLNLAQQNYGREIKSDAAEPGRASRRGRRVYPRSSDAAATEAVVVAWWGASAAATEPVVVSASASAGARPATPCPRCFCACSSSRLRNVGASQSRRVGWRRPAEIPSVVVRSQREKTEVSEVSDRPVDWDMRVQELRVELFIIEAIWAVGYIWINGSDQMFLPSLLFYM